MEKVKPLRVYVETSVWNFAFAEDVPVHREHTLQFIDRCRLGLLHPVISRMVLEELVAAPAALRTKLLDLVAEINPEVLVAGDQTRALAARFITDGAVPKSKPFDALHVAVAFVENVAVLTSWNFKHITNVRRSQRFNAIALAFGIDHRVEIVSPPELLNEDEAQDRV